jgi:cysteinyl-tRNA synthetase
MAKYWLHCSHLHVDGKKMSKSKGNVYYTDTLRDRGYGIDEVRFFLIYGHYRRNLNYSTRAMNRAAEKLRDFKRTISDLEATSNEKLGIDEGVYHKVKGLFSSKMDQDLDVRGAFDGLHGFLSGPEAGHGDPRASAGILKALREIDEVLRVIF